MSSPPRDSSESRQQLLQGIKENKSKVSKVTHESVASTRQMLQLVNESQNTAVGTLQELDRQGESLNRAETHLDYIDSDLQDSEKTLKRMSVMERVPLLLLPAYLAVKSKTPPRPERSEPVLGQTPSESKPESRKSVVKIVDHWEWKRNDQEPETTSKEDVQSERFFRSITGAPEEQEIEQNLDTVSRHLSQLKEQASLMGSTVKSHNSQLDRINTKTENNQEKIKALHKRTQKLLGNKVSSEGVSFVDPFSLGRCFRCTIM